MPDKVILIDKSNRKIGEMVVAHVRRLTDCFELHTRKPIGGWAISEYADEREAIRDGEKFVQREYIKREVAA